MLYFTVILTFLDVEFDPDADGTALITMVAGLSPHYQPPIIPPGSANEEGIGKGGAEGLT
jgi:hypothetical protein